MGGCRNVVHVIQAQHMTRRSPAWGAWKKQTAGRNVCTYPISPITGIVTVRLTHEILHAARFEAQGCINWVAYYQVANGVLGGSFVVVGVARSVVMLRGDNGRRSGSFTMAQT